MKKLLQSNAFKNFGSSTIVTLIRLLIRTVVILISNPNEALGGLRTLLAGPVEDGMLGIGRVLYYMVPIIMTGLSVGFASKTGLFNIGTPGQSIIGAFAAVCIGVKWAFLPDSIHWLVTTLTAFAVGGLWAVVPGVMKTYLNVNEVISSIMVNYIGMYLVNCSVSLVLFNALRNQSLPVTSATVIPKIGSDKIFTGSPANGGSAITILFVILIYIISNRASFGYGMGVYGFNKDASRYAGIDERCNIILSAVIAGALTDVDGRLLYLSDSGKFIEVVDVLPVEGFNGIPVALLSLSNPIGVLFTGLFVAYLNVGGNTMQQFGFVSQIVDTIISCIIYCSALSLMIKVWLSKCKKAKELGTVKKEGE